MPIILFYIKDTKEKKIRNNALIGSWGDYNLQKKQGSGLSNEIDEEEENRGEKTINMKK